MRNLTFARSFVLPALALAMFASEFASLSLWATTDEAVGFSSEGGSSSESYLGVDTRDITPDRLATLQLKEEKGVEVTMVDQDAPAGKAGLKEHERHPQRQRHCC